MILSVISVLVDLFFNAAFTWSFIVFISLLALWIFAVLPLFFEKKRKMLFITADVVIASLYLILLDIWTGTELWSWYAAGGMVFLWILLILPFLFKKETLFC